MTANRERIAVLVSRLSREAAENAVSDDDRAVAAATMGVPVYSDMGGTLVVMPDGSVQRYNHDIRAMFVADEFWRVIAMNHAIRKYPELRVLADEPLVEVVCSDCKGSGMRAGVVRCVRCVGTGFVYFE